MYNKEQYDFENALKHELFIRKTVSNLLYQFNRNDDLDDLVSEILIKVAKNIHQFHNNSAKIETWIYAICRNHIISHIRKQKFNPDKHLDVDECAFLKANDMYSNPEKCILQKEDHSYLNKIISNLTENQQKVLALFLQDLSYEEIAKKTGFTLGAVKSLLFRTRTALKKEFYGFAV